jgi:hypothetical protein
MNQGKNHPRPLLEKRRGAVPSGPADKAKKPLSLMLLWVAGIGPVRAAGSFEFPSFLLGGARGG